jgi:hypothetical protein
MHFFHDVHKNILLLLCAVFGRVECFPSKGARRGRQSFRNLSRHAASGVYRAFFSRLRYLPVQAQTLRRSERLFQQRRNHGNVLGLVPVHLLFFLAACCLEQIHKLKFGAGKSPLFPSRKAPSIVAFLVPIRFQIPFHSSLWQTQRPSAAIS